LIYELTIDHPIVKHR